MAILESLTFPAICARSGKRARTRIKTVFTRVPAGERPKGFRHTWRQSRPVRIRIPSTWSRKIGRLLLATIGLVGLIVGPFWAIIAVIDKLPFSFAPGVSVAIVAILLLIYTATIWIDGWIEGEELVIVGASERFAMAVQDETSQVKVEPFN